MYNLFNSVLLHTLNTHWVDSDLFLKDVVVHGRRRLVHTRKSKNVHAFHNLLLDLRDRHVNNLFNCVLLHTFHALFLSSGLFLTDLVVHMRSKIIQERR